MVKDIPTQDEFNAVGLSLLDHAWDAAINLLLSLGEAEGIIDDADVPTYWLAAKIKLSTALAIAQQGAEFLIKGRIVQISPYLLIANPPREWPAPNSAGEISFTKFRTIDAQDLIRIHDASGPSPLPVEFKEVFESLRVRRNTIVHTVDPSAQVDVSELLENILRIHEVLLADESWVELRRSSLEDSTNSILFSSDWVEASIVREFAMVRESLAPKAMLRYFNHDKKQRAYLCTTCTLAARDMDFKSFSAILKPNNPESTQTWCYVCNETHLVKRVDCTTEDCPGNVIEESENQCLTCGEDQIQAP